MIKKLDKGDPLSSVIYRLSKEIVDNLNDKLTPDEYPYMKDKVQMAVSAAMTSIGIVMEIALRDASRDNKVLAVSELTISLETMLKTVLEVDD